MLFDVEVHCQECRLSIVIQSFNPYTFDRLFPCLFSNQSTFSSNLSSLNLFYSLSFALDVKCLYILVTQGVVSSCPFLSSFSISFSFNASLFSLVRFSFEFKFAYLLCVRPVRCQWNPCTLFPSSFRSSIPILFAPHSLYCLFTFHLLPSKFAPLIRFAFILIPSILIQLPMSFPTLSSLFLPIWIRHIDFSTSFYDPLANPD